MNLTRKTNARLGRPVLLALLAMMLLLAAMPLTAVAASQGTAAAVEDVTIMIDDKAVKLADPARMKSNKLYMPVGQLAKLLGAQVSWDSRNDEATIVTATNDKIVLGNGVPVVYFNDARYVMDAAPFEMDGRLYVPLRDAAELLHAKVVWNGEERTATLKRVPLAVVTEDAGLDKIAEEHEVSAKHLLKRNGLQAVASVETGTELRVVIPSIFDREAKPFTEKEYQLLARIVQVESGYESYEGQLAVANVILNRVKDPRFPDTIKEVIYAGKQFPPAHNGLLDKSVAKETALRAAKDALNGKNNIEDALYFYNPKVSKGSFWSSLTVVDTIGSHRFAK